MCYELTEKFLNEVNTKKWEVICAEEKIKKPPMIVKEMIHFMGTVLLSMI